MLLATTAAGACPRESAWPTATPTTGPIATFCGRNPIAPTTAPVAVPTARGPAPVAFPSSHPSGAASAVLTAMRCHSAGISPSCCRARATASDVPRPTAPTSAAPAADLTPWCAASDAPASPPIDAATPTEEVVATLMSLGHPTFLAISPTHAHWSDPLITGQRACVTPSTG